jgi:Pyrimidine dimer DNA glycosylase
MRLWTIHPRYLDAKGLVAAWREALLAQKVLSGDTSGYKHHPQLIRFRLQTNPIDAIGAFLIAIADEAKLRNYRFDTSKILSSGCDGQIEATNDQLLYEWQHLKQKLKLRAPDFYQRYGAIAMPEPHPLFRIVEGNISDWEKI